MCSEQLGKPFDLNPHAKAAIRVQDADFQWETAEPLLQDAGLSKMKPTNKNEKKADKKQAKVKAAHHQQVKRDKLVNDDDEAAQENPFKLSNIELEIKRGELVAVVGSVGSGKSSLLAGLVCSTSFFCVTRISMLT